MIDHKQALAVLEKLEYETSHSARALEHNGFHFTGMYANDDLAASLKAIYKQIDAMKQVVLLDGYNTRKITVSS